jgi:regulator of protease activity HflC (stomatin/prohibitin superfamily)
MGTLKDGRGWTLEQSLAGVMASEAYDMDRDRVPDGVTIPAESHRVAMIREVMTAYKQRARAALFEKYPDLYAAWREYEEYEKAAKSGVAQPGARENLILEF